jgi:hypothetical protein
MQLPLYVVIIATICGIIVSTDILPLEIKAIDINCHELLIHLRQKELKNIFSVYLAQRRFL